ncbi:uncharacterized protein TEOVI_000548000 [Trypanosoma equiperdum]|uniref:Uncharacterized protein n=1 Tax=Trypanosoma equiperdum TaxID=5694 RepID=A0A1G4HZ05_TRYEQ|nr:hypothetical protein, conserved [Trypanosoma equiperdum]
MDPLDDWDVVGADDFTPRVSSGDKNEDPSTKKDADDSLLNHEENAVSSKDSVNVYNTPSFVKSKCRIPSGPQVVRNDSTPSNNYNIVASPGNEGEPSVQRPPAHREITGASVLQARGILHESFDNSNAQEVVHRCQYVKHAVEPQQNSVSAVSNSRLYNLIGKLLCAGQLLGLATPISDGEEQNCWALSVKLWSHTSCIIKQMGSAGQLMCFMVFLYFVSAAPVGRNKTEHCSPSINCCSLFKDGVRYFCYLLFLVGPLLRIAEFAVQKRSFGKALHGCEVGGRAHKIVCKAVTWFGKCILTTALIVPQEPKGGAAVSYVTAKETVGSCKTKVSDTTECFARVNSASEKAVLGVNRLLFVVVCISLVSIMRDAEERCTPSSR